MRQAGDVKVEKGAKKHKLDVQGNIIDPDAPGAGPSSSGGAGGGFGGSAFAGGSGGSSSFDFGGAPTGGGGGGGGFSFSSTLEVSDGGVFKYGGGSAPASDGGGSTFQGGSTTAPAKPSKRLVPSSDAPAVKTKRRRMMEIRRTGTESGACFVVGNGDCGQLGLGAEDDDVRDTLVPLPLPPLSSARVSTLVCGGLHTAALTLDGAIWSWGCNDDEVLGRPGEESVPHRVKGVLSGVRISMISAGDSHMAALSSDGRVFSWGTYKDSNGYIGYGADELKASEPRLVKSLEHVKISYIASGYDHTMAVSADGFDVYGWGCGEKGQLGRELEWTKVTKRNYLQPTQPLQLMLPDAGGEGSRARLARALNSNLLDFFECEVAADPSLDTTEACEAYLAYRKEIEREEATLETRLKVVKVFGGAYHTFLLTASQNVYACGLNNMGQLGLGGMEPAHTGTPTLVATLESKQVCALSAGEHHSLALTDAGEVYAFGRGDNNQLGLGPGHDCEPTPVLVEALADARIYAISSGSNQNMAVSRAGDLYSWGFGEMGQLANGKAADEPMPKLVEAVELEGGAVVTAASGGQHSAIVVMQA